MTIQFSESSPFVLTWGCAVLISGRARWKTCQLVHWSQLFCGKIITLSVTGMKSFQLIFFLYSQKF